MRLRGPHAGPDALVPVPGWSDRLDGVTPEPHWIAAIEHATVARVAQLRALMRGTVEARPAPIPAPGWTTRLALDEPEVIVCSGRATGGHVAFGLFAADRPSLALYDAGNIISFGDPSCAQRLRVSLDLPPLRLGDLDIRAVRHPAGTVPGAWTRLRVAPLQVRDEDERRTPKLTGEQRRCEHDPDDGADRDHDRT